MIENGSRIVQACVGATGRPDLSFLPMAHTFSDPCVHNQVLHETCYSTFPRASIPCLWKPASCKIDNRKFRRSYPCIPYRPKMDWAESGGGTTSSTLRAKLQADIHITDNILPRSIAHTSLLHDLVVALPPPRSTIENGGF
jgi:hypothetical protein